MMFLNLSLNILLHIVVMAMAFSSNCLVPIHYDLKLKVESRYTLKGESNITVSINCATQNITFDISTLLNIMNMNIKSVMNSKIYTVNYIKRLNEAAVVNFAEQLGPNNNLERGFYIVNIDFKNPISTRYFSGISLRTFWYEHKQKEWIMAILNQPRTARELFPCWDEPELTATFNISVEHDSECEALSNMPTREYEFIDNETTTQQRQITYFETTPKISPNDVAILIYKNNVVHPIHLFHWKGTVMRTWCRPYSAPYVKFGLNVAAMIIWNLKNEWDILKDVSKVDYVAVPNFENKIWLTWGLIIYNEADLAYDEKLHLPAHKFIMMRSIAHDIIYQHYGYIFDASYWWLNEGFILFFETYIIDQIFPDSRIMDLFIVQSQYESRFLTINGTTNTNNFTKDTSDTFNIKSISFFSPIKGAFMWRMLQSKIPDSIFWRCINTYLKLPNSSKTPDDLWNIMDNEKKKYDYHFYDLYHLRNVKEVMNSWSTQKYCPVLNVTRDYSTDQVIISKEFDEKFGKTPYFIPVTFTMDTNINFNAGWSYTKNYLKKSEPTLEILLDKTVEWIIVNIQQAEYYRVNYDKENWQRLAHYLNSENYSNIHDLNRAQIIDDAFYMAVNGKLDFAIFWELASYLWREKDYIAWYPMIKTFQYTSIIYAFPSNLATFPTSLQNVIDKIRNLFQSIHEDTYNQIIPTSNDFDKFLKQELSRIACIINNALCIRAAERQLELYLHDARMYTILPGWQKWTYCNGLKYANQTTWIYVWIEASKIYKEKSDYKMLEGLLCSDNPEIIIDYLSHYLTRYKNQFINNDGIITKEVERKVNSLTANIFLSTFTRHAKNTKILKKLLDHYNLIEFRFSHVNINAALIVMINNAYSAEQLSEIYKFVTRFYTSPLRLQHIARTISIRMRKTMDQLLFFNNLYQPPSLD